MLEQVYCRRKFDTVNSLKPAFVFPTATSLHWLLTVSVNGDILCSVSWITMADVSNKNKGTPMVSIAADTDHAMPGCAVLAHLCFTGLEPEVGLHPALWTVDHTSSITCRYLPGYYTDTKLVSGVHGCEQLAHSRYANNFR